MVLLLVLLPPVLVNLMFMAIAGLFSVWSLHRFHSVIGKPCNSPRIDIYSRIHFSFFELLGAHGKNVSRVRPVNEPVGGFDAVKL